MWRPTPPDVLNRIICDQKQKFIKRANKVFCPDPKFRQMKKDQLIETYTPIIYTVPVKLVMPNMTAMRSFCITLEDYTVIQLRKIAQERGVKGYYKYNKSELIQSLRIKGM
jgi:hypothetical protein